jgi:hypothetical protein
MNGKLVKFLHDFTLTATARTRHFCLHTCVLGLRNGYTPCLGSLNVDGAALLGVREVLNLEELEHTILLHESEDEEGMVLELGALDGRPCGCELHRS